MSAFLPSRRLVLQGAASSLALPLLPSLLPREARAATSAPPRRMIAWFAPNGMLPESSRPDVAGPLGALPASIAPLSAIADRATVISELRNMATEDARAGCDHSRGLGTLLNDRSVDITVPTFNAAITFDQVIANAIAGSTPFASLQLGCEPPDGFCSTASNDCTYQRTLSWASPTQPLNPLSDARQVFELMFGGEDSGASAAETQARAALQYSVLDRVMERTSALSASASTADRDKLDQYLTGIRDLESRLQQLENVECAEPPRPGGNLALPQLHEAMRQLMVVALQCDYTRVITFLSGRSASGLFYNHLPLINNTSHHLLSHHNNLASWVSDLKQVQAYLVEQYVLLAQDLEAVDDGVGGTLLDHTALLYMSEFGDALVHDYGDLTWLLAGGEAHGWVHGQHRPQGYRAHADVFLNLLDFMGVPGATFGENGVAQVDMS